MWRAAQHGFVHRGIASKELSSCHSNDHFAVWTASTHLGVPGVPAPVDQAIRLIKAGLVLQGYVHL